MNKFKKALWMVSAWRRLRNDRLSAPSFGEINSQWRHLPGRTPKSSILLLSEQRSGSYWLCRLMQRCGVMGRPHEYFNPDWMKKHFIDYPDDVTRQLEWTKYLGTTVNGVVSVKIQTWMLDRLIRDIDILKEFPAPTVVLLTRNDLLGQAISLTRAKQTQAWTSWSQEILAPGKNPKPVYDGEAIYENMQLLIEQTMRFDLFVARNGLRPLRLAYEDVLRAPVHTLLKIAETARIADLPRRDLIEWHDFELQRDQMSNEWRRRFITDFGNSRVVDLPERNLEVRAGRAFLALFPHRRDVRRDTRVDFLRDLARVHAAAGGWEEAARLLEIARAQCCNDSNIEALLREYAEKREASAAQSNLRPLSGSQAQSHCD